MGRRILMYDIVSQVTGESLSRHRTRQAALDAWREGFRGVPIRIFRLAGNNEKDLVLEGTWHTG
jgi:hypothetical protein